MRRTLPPRMHHPAVSCFMSVLQKYRVQDIQKKRCKSNEIRWLSILTVVDDSSLLNIWN